MRHTGGEEGVHRLYVSGAAADYVAKWRAVVVGERQLPQMVEKANAVRPGGDIPMFEAMQKAKEPRWVPFTFPIIGVIGVLVGGKLKRRS